MKIEEQVLSIEQAKHLQELGLDMIDAAHFWCSMKLDTQGHEIKKREWYITLDKSQMHCGFMTFEYIPTYTLQEVMGELPKKIENTRHEIFWLNFYYDSISYQDYDGCLIIRFDLFPSPLQSLYKILCWVLENGYLKEDKK